MTVPLEAHALRSFLAATDGGLSRTRLTRTVNLDGKGAKQ
jgi:hypothetical protein